jgi:ABC-type polysaccharide/polyol phosphate transport system ATPase subunit
MIEFNGVSKQFIIDEDRARSFQEKLVRALGRGDRQNGQTEVFWALRDVSFTIDRGDAVGIIGSNGSGKSTVLKLIARIIYPTSGIMTTCGRVAALLELGAGFHSDLTGRENIDLNGSILGLRRQDVRRQADEIIAFSELERFIDVPIRNYSSGMMMRLGFAVATAFQPEILLIDEVLAVGDQAFQDRCMRRILEIQREGATILLVSHDLSSIKKLCRRSIWLDDGRVCADGKTDTVAGQYLSGLWNDQAQRTPRDGVEFVDEGGDALASLSTVDGAATETGSGARWGSGEIKIERARILGPDGNPASVFRTGDRFMVRVWYHAHRRIESPAFGVSIYDELGNRINGPNTVWGQAGPDVAQGRGVVDYVVDALPLLNGRYDLTVAVYDHLVTHPYDHWDRMATFTVVPGEEERQDGVVFIPCRWEHQR